MPEPSTQSEEERPDDTEGTLAAMELSAAIQAMRRLGFDVTAILARAGIGEAALSEPFARIPARQEHRLWAAVESMTKDPAVGLRVGVEHARGGTPSLLEYLIAHSPTVGEALEAVRRMVPLVDDRGHVEVALDGDLARVAIRRDGLTRARGYVDCLTALVFTFYTEHIEGFHLAGVAFARPPPRSARPYAALFGVTPVFQAARNELSFARRFLSEKFAGADPNVGALLRDHAENLLKNVPRGDPFLESVRRELSRELRAGRASPGSVARTLGASVRTLRRRLSALGTSYQALLDEQRRSAACHRLRYSDDSMDLIAETLGFSSRTAFQRAFRRYTGQSPSEYRAAATEGAP